MALVSQGLNEQQEFLKEWSVSRVENMTLEEYSNNDKETSFIYCIEFKTEHTGSISGGSAYKFGIYKRKDTTKEVNSGNRITDGVYAWHSKYGNTREEAFANVKQMIVTIVKASINSHFNEIDSIDLGDAIKWKIAFLYNSNNLVPIFKRDALVKAANSYEVSNAVQLPISELQKVLISQREKNITTLEFAKSLWQKFIHEDFFTSLESFLEQAKTDNLRKKGFPTAYRKLDFKVSFGVGNTARVPWIALLKEPNKVTDGIYPVYLYFKSQDILILSYGLSETDESKYFWPAADKYQTISDWFKMNKEIQPERYGSSYVKAVYDLSEELDAEIIQKDLDEIIQN
jgi:5-methylcytosine-specific restriction endonuclease McrBC GTP-binding regulatory subunit McrB